MVTGVYIGPLRHGSQVWKNVRKGVIGAEGQPNLDAAIRDRVYAESILDRVQLFY